MHGKPRITPVVDMLRFVAYFQIDSIRGSWKKSSRDEMYRAILVGFFLLQTVLSYLIPVIGPALSFIHLSWLYALYCFEYKWSLAGWTLERKLMHLEKNWFDFDKGHSYFHRTDKRIWRAYFAGFGSPFTLATFFVPNFVSKGVFALLFPVVRSPIAIPKNDSIALLSFQFLLLAIACDYSTLDTQQSAAFNFSIFGSSHFIKYTSIALSSSHFYVPDFRNGSLYNCYES